MTEPLPSDPAGGAAADPAPVTGRWVDVPIDDPGGGSLPAYLARPHTPGEHPTVVVGFEMFGVTGYVRGVTERIAALGYTAVAPDFYHRLGTRIELPTTPAGRDRGLRLLGELHRAGVLRDVRAVLSHLPSDRAAMVGLSVGGHIAYYAATQLPLAALAVFYPGWLTDTGIALSRPRPTVTLTPQMARFDPRVLFMIGSADHLYDPTQRELIAERLRASGVRHDFVVYPDAPHGFFCHERDTYRPAAAEDAFDRLAALLAVELQAAIEASNWQ